MSAKRAKMKWPPRTRQPGRTRCPVTTTKVAPVYGPATVPDFAELHARLVNGKAF